MELFETLETFETAQYRCCRVMSLIGKGYRSVIKYVEHVDMPEHFLPVIAERNGLLNVFDTSMSISYQNTLWIDVSGLFYKHKYRISSL